jgi:hypothetical protein
LNWAPHIRPSHTVPATTATTPLFIECTRISKVEFAVFSFSDPSHLRLAVTFLVR